MDQISFFDIEGEKISNVALKRLRLILRGHLYGQGKNKDRLRCPYLLAYALEIPSIISFVDLSFDISGVLFSSQIRTTCPVSFRKSSDFIYLQVFQEMTQRNIF